jgi:hypothetical protein
MGESLSLVPVSEAIRLSLRRVLCRAFVEHSPERTTQTRIKNNGTADQLHHADKWQRPISVYLNSRKGTAQAVSMTVTDEDLRGFPIALGR